MSSLKILSVKSTGIKIFPPEMGRLQKLERLIVSHSPLRAIPDTFCEMSSLYELDVSNTQVATLPEHIARLQHLSILSIHKTNIKMLPESFGSLQNLRIFHANDTDIEELPVSFANLLNLKSLSLSGSPLRLLPDVFSAEHKLQFILVDSARLESLPDSLGLVHLVVASFQNNQLRKLPASVPNWSDLIILHVGNNSLETLPPMGHCMALSIVDFSSNKLTSVFDKEDHPDITELYIDNNRLSVLPSGNLTSLQILDASHNSLTVDEKTTWGDWPQLVLLDLGYNQIDSLSFFQKKNTWAALKTLNVEGNRDLRSPGNVCRSTVGLNSLTLSETSVTDFPLGCFVLQELRMDRMVNLTEMPNPMHQLTSLEYLSITFTDIWEVDDAVFSMRELRTLNLSHNAVTSIRVGNFPKSPSPLLRVVDLSYNLLWGTSFMAPEERPGLGEIRSTFIQLQNLAYLDLSNNMLSGVFTNYWMSVSTLDLSRNSFNTFKGLSESSPFLAQVDLSNNLDVLDSLEMKPGRLFAALKLQNTRLSTGFFSKLRIRNDSDSLLLWDSPNVQCHPLDYGGVAIDINPRQLNYSHCSCLGESGTRFWNPHRQDCEVCPEGVICDPQVNAVAHTIRAGYYPVRLGQPCPFYGAEMNLHCDVVECLPSSRCNPDEKVDFQCRDGYDNRSVLCSACKDGYFRPGNSCWKCPSHAEVVVPLAWTLSLLFWFSYVLFKYWRMSRGHGRRGSVDIFISYLQVTLLLWRSISLDAASRVSSSDGVIASMLSVTYNIAFVSPLGMDCLNPDFSEKGGIFWLTLSFPFLFGVCLLLLHVLIMFFNRKAANGGNALGTVSQSSFHFTNIADERALLEDAGHSSASGSFGDSLSPHASPPPPPPSRHRATTSSASHQHNHRSNSSGDSEHAAPASRRTAFYVQLMDGSYFQRSYSHLPMFFFNYILLIMYVELCSQIFSTFACRDLGGTSVLVRDPQISCSSNQYAARLVGATIGAVIFAAGIPLFFVYQVLQRVGDPSDRMGRIGMVYLPMRDEFKLWNVYVVMGQKLLVVLIISIVDVRSALVPFLVFVVLLTSCFLQLWYQPYRHRGDNFLASSLLVLASATYFGRVAALLQNFSGGPSLVFFLLLSNVIIGTGVLAYIIFMTVIKKGWKGAKKLGRSLIGSNTASVNQHAAGFPLVLSDSDSDGALDNPGRTYLLEHRDSDSSR